MSTTDIKRFSPFLAAGCAGLVELSLFHPVDTIAKRLQSNRQLATSWDGLLSLDPQRRLLARSHYSQVIFGPETTSGTFSSRVASLFPGIGFAFCFKVSQRIYKWGCQPILREKLEQRYGNGRNRTALEAISGSMIGMGEVALLPFDVLKIKAQTNKSALQKGVLSGGIRGLYRGAVVTASRNAMGSAALFGSNAAVQIYMKGEMPSRHRHSPGPVHWPSLLLGSTVGAVSSILVANPLDVIKTRLQNQDFTSQVGAPDSHPISKQRLE